MSFFQVRCIGEDEAVLNGVVLTNGGIGRDGTAAAHRGVLTHNYVLTNFAVGGKLAIVANLRALSDDAERPNNGIVADYNAFFYVGQWMDFRGFRNHTKRVGHSLGG